MMQRRQMLIGSGAMLATGLAGYASASSAYGTKTSEDEKSKKEDLKEKKQKEDDHQRIPGFDQRDFELDSDVLHVKDIVFHKGTLELSVMVTTTDQDILAEELQALVPGFRQAIREADVEEFFEAVEEFKFTLYDESKVKRAAVYLDIQWLRDCLFGDLANEEFVSRILSLIGGLRDREELAESDY